MEGIEVETHYYCSALTTAPKMRTVAPSFADRYAKRFRNGSHWRITDDEHQDLGAAIEQAGRAHKALSPTPSL